MEIYFKILYLTFCVCQGNHALLILISIVRTYGKYYLSSFIVLRVYSYLEFVAVKLNVLRFGIVTEWLEL